MLVYDKNIFGSKRDIDANGYLRVEVCNITKTQVAPYLGKEIPDYESFGLEPNKIYFVLRPEEELVKAIPSFNNLPLCRKHIEVDVNNVPSKDIVGSLGDKTEYERPYLKNSLIVYDKKEIDQIMSGKKKELSCGYRYTPVRESGMYDGKPYDFKMTDIVGNHIALVKEGRAGHDVVVSDTVEYVKEKIMSLFGKKEVVNDEFKEADHPRDKEGKFTKAGDVEKSLVEFKEHKNAAGESSERAEFEYKGAKVEATREGKFIQYKIHAPKGTAFNSGDLFYTGETYSSDFEGLVKKIIDNEKFNVIPEEFNKNNDIVEDKAIPEKQEDPKKAGEEKALKDGEKEMADKEEVKEASEEKVENKEPAKEEVVEDKAEVKPEEAEKEEKSEKAEDPKKEEKADEKPAEPAKEDKKEDKEEEEGEKCHAKDKCAMDSQMAMDIDAIKAQVREEVMEDLKARDMARKAVRSTVGDVEIMAFDSADSIYKFACEKTGMNCEGIVSYKDAYTGYLAGKGSKLALDASPKSGSNVECFKDIRID
jgi:hypothetical protein